MDIVIAAGVLAVAIVFAAALFGRRSQAPAGSPPDAEPGARDRERILAVEEDNATRRRELDRREAELAARLGS